LSPPGQLIHPQGAPTARPADAAVRARSRGGRCSAARQPPPWREGRDARAGALRAPQPKTRGGKGQARARLSGRAGGEARTRGRPRKGGEPLCGGGERIATPPQGGGTPRRRRCGGGALAPPYFTRGPPKGRGPRRAVFWPGRGPRLAGIARLQTPKGRTFQPPLRKQQTPQNHDRLAPSTRNPERPHGLGPERGPLVSQRAARGVRRASVSGLWDGRRWAMVWGSLGCGPGAVVGRSGHLWAVVVLWVWACGNDSGLAV
jgi:hypothetical protein